MSGTSVSVERSQAESSLVWSVVENAGLTLVSFGTLILYSRLLSASDFGLFSVVLALVELLGVLVSMLFHDALVQKQGVTRLHFDTAFTGTLVLSLVLFAGCQLLAGQFAQVVGNPAAEAALRWTSLYLPCSALTATIVAQQHRDLAFRPLALRSLVGRLSGAAAGLCLVVLGAGFWGLVAQQVLIAAMGSAVLWVAASASRPRLAFGRREFSSLLGFGGYSVGTLFLTFAVKRVFTIWAGALLGSEAAGYLNLSFRAVDVLWAIAATAVTQVALPVLARLQSDPARLKATYRSALEFTCLMLYPCFVGIALTAPEVVELLFGAQWLASSPYVSALALLIVVQAPRLLITPLLTALGRPRDLLVGVFVELSTVVLCFAVWRVPSLTGVVAVWMARELLAAPVMALLLRRAAQIGLREQLRGVITPALTAGSMAVAVYGVRLLLPAGLGAASRLGLLAGTGVLVFGAAGWAFDRPSMLRVIEFVQSALRRVRERPAAC